MATVGQPDVGDAPAQHPDHHRFDDREGEQGGCRGVDGVAAVQQHLHGRGGRERVIRHHHRPRTDGGPFLAGEGGEAFCGYVSAHAGSTPFVKASTILAEKPGPSPAASSHLSVPQGERRGFRDVEEVPVGREHDQLVSDAQRGEQGVDGPDLHTAAAASIAQVRRFDVVGVMKGIAAKRSTMLVASRDPRNP